MPLHPPSLNPIPHPTMKLTDADDDDGIQADATSNLEASFELNDTLYSRASISPADTEEVYLWLGANVMLAYPIAEAEDLLQEKLSAAQLTLSNCEEDQEFLREQITVCPLPCPGLLHEWYTNRSRRWRSQRLACITGMWCSGGMTRQKGKEMRVVTLIRRALVVNLLVCFAFFQCICPGRQNQSTRITEPDIEVRRSSSQSNPVSLPSRIY